MSEVYDVTLIGLGAMGSAAAYQLSRTNKRVLGIDQFSPPHTLGSSHGQTRITREAIGEGRRYVPLVQRSHEIWRSLEKMTGEELLTCCGGLVFGPGLSPLVHGSENFLEETIAAAKEFDIEHEVLEPEELCQRFPQFRYAESEIGYYEPGAGFVRPERCIEVQLGLAEQNNVNVHRNERVLEVRPNSANDGVRVITEMGEYLSEFAIITSGPWVTSFLPEMFRNQFRVCRQVLHWFDVEAPRERFLPGVFPVFIRLGRTEGDHYYGFPVIDGVDQGLKVASEQFNILCDPDTVDREVSQTEMDNMYDQLQKVLPVTRNCIRAEVCVYTATPDYGFVIDTLPDSPQIICASPCSGHGFKHSAAIGEALRDIVTVGQSSFELSSFKLARLLESRQLES